MKVGFHSTSGEEPTSRSLKIGSEGRRSDSSSSNSQSEGGAYQVSIVSGARRGGEVWNESHSTHLEIFHHAPNQPGDLLQETLPTAG